MFFALNPSKNVDDVSAGPMVATALGSTTIVEAGNNDGAEGARSKVTDIAAAAKLFIFPGYIVFTLMGSIVEDFDMLSRRSDLLTTSLLFSAAPRRRSY